MQQVQYAGIDGSAQPLEVALEAQLILDYTQRMPFQPWQPPDESSLHLQALTRRINQLKRALVAERTRLQAEAYRGVPTDQASPRRRHAQAAAYHLGRMDPCPGLRQRKIL